MDGQRKETLDAIQRFIFQKEMELRKRSNLSIEIMESGLEKCTITQLHLITLINDLPEKATNTFMAEELGLSKPAITKALKVLIQNQLVVSNQKESNKKSVYYCVTDKGQAIAHLHKHLHQKAVEKYNALFDQFTESELKVVATFLDEWATHLTKERTL